MPPRLLSALGTCVIVTLTIGGTVRVAAAQAARGTAGGTIRGHVRLSGEEPGNPVIRMGRDPMCAAINRGKRVIQEAVLASLDGSLANVFVKLQGSFPQVPVPPEPVTIDQRGCVYLPRVVGVRVGQTLQVRNSDSLLHNVHSSTTIKENSFNIGQPIAGMVHQFRLKEEPGMLRLMCDVHSWMTSYIGVVSHPYFAVSNKAGTFEIANVPPGTYMIMAWQERYGPVTRMVTVRAGAVAAVEFTYTGKEKPPD